MLLRNVKVTARWTGEKVQSSGHWGNKKQLCLYGILIKIQLYINEWQDRTITLREAYIKKIFKFFRSIKRKEIITVTVIGHLKEACGPPGVKRNKSNRQKHRVLGEGQGVEKRRGRGNIPEGTGWEHCFLLSVLGYMKEAKETVHVCEGIRKQLQT